MPKVLTTGGTGFCGTWLRRTQPDNVTAFYFNREKYQSTWWETIGRYDYVIHLANVEPSRAIVCARRNNARLLYCSSGAAYDQQTDYAENKRRWEDECLDSGVDVVIARLFTFFGDRLDDGKAYTQFMRAARAGKPLQVWGDGSTVRSYQHGREMARWMWAVLLMGKSGETYDVGSSRPTTQLRLAQRIAAAAGCGIEFVDSAVAVPYYMPRDTAKTRALLEKGKR
jgi:nucleoside-diphosphate-sugar epimerase